ncbi:MAG: ATP-binding cassette domain-containing protein, partial [Ilumatobacter sp.]
MLDRDGTGPEPDVVAVQMTGITRRFGSTIALDGVDLTLRTGEVHAVLGANGAGKTTLMRILAGLERPDAGSVSVRGEPVERFAPGVARDAGIALVQQHFTLVPTLTATENLVLARPTGPLRPRRNQAGDRLAALVERFGLPVRDGVPTGQLSVGEQQRLELIRALDADADVLVLDEPTAVLTDAEADQLLEVCRGLAADGRAVAIITHRLGEVIAGCDRVTVLRDGRPVLADRPVVEHDRSGLATAMIGEDARGSFVDRDRSSTAKRGRPALRVIQLSSGMLDGVTIDVAAGEVVGIAGIDGNGQGDLEAVLAGRRVPDGGEVSVIGSAVVAGDPRSRRQAGVAYIPSDR